MSYHTGPAYLFLEVWQPLGAYSCHSRSSKPSPLNPTRVNFNILFKSNLLFIDFLDDGRIHLLGGGPTTTLQTSCSFDLSSFLRHSETSHATLSERLSSLGFGEDTVGALVAGIFSRGQILFSERESNKGKRDIFFNVEIKKDQPVWMHYERHRVIRESMQELESRNYGMVPASESSLGLLKRVRVTAITNGENQQPNSCSICLEEVDVGSEATSLPCSHLFHGECIVKWLKQSHYCPICRYEMPTH